jgi:hypothetical protein
MVARMDLRHHMASLAPTPERSAALIMAELREASPLVGSRAMAEASTEAEGATEEAVTGNSAPLPQTKLMIWRKNLCRQII